MAKKKKKDCVPLPNMDLRGPTIRVWGVDPSLNNTVICMGRLSLGRIERFTSVKLKPKGKSQEQRMDWIYKRVLSSLNKRIKNHILPDLIVIEGFSYGSNMYRETLGAVAFIIRMLVTRFEIPIIVLSPKTVKRYLQSGNMKKQLVIKEVFKSFGEDFNNDDEADAFVMMKIGMAILKIQKEELLEEPDFRIKCAVDILIGKTGDIILPE